MLMCFINAVTKLGDDGVRALSAGLKGVPRLTLLALSGMKGWILQCTVSSLSV